MQQTRLVETQRAAPREVPQRSRLKLFSGRGNPGLAQEIAAGLDVPLAEMSIFRFADGEIGVRIEESVRGEDVFVIQSTSPPVNENLMELLVMVDALRRASADRITAVIPYFGYARQDRKMRPREPKYGMTAVIRSAEARRNASTITSNSIKFSFTGGLVDWMTNTSSPRTLSSMRTPISPSAKRKMLISASGTSSPAAISCSSPGLPRPLNSFSRERCGTSRGAARCVSTKRVCCICCASTACGSPGD